MTDVSIIIPTYNRENTVTTAINSCIEENSLVLEVIVVDDGFTGNTQQKIKDSYTGWLYHAGQQSFSLTKNTKTIRADTQPNAGAPAARNNGIQQEST